MGPQGDEVHNTGNGNVMNTAVDQMVPFQSPLFQGAVIHFFFLEQFAS
jgi:hypothetical protein